MSNINAHMYTAESPERFEVESPERFEVDEPADLAPQSQHAPSSSSMAARSLAEQVLADTGFEAGQSSQIISAAGHLSLTVSQIRRLGDDAAIQIANDNRVVGVSKEVCVPKRTKPRGSSSYNVNKSGGVLEKFGFTSHLSEGEAAKLALALKSLKNGGINASKKNRPENLQKRNIPFGELMDYFEEVERQALAGTPQGS